MAFNHEDWINNDASILNTVAENSKPSGDKTIISIPSSYMPNNEAFSLTTDSSITPITVVNAIRTQYYARKDSQEAEKASNDRVGEDAPRRADKPDPRKRREVGKPSLQEVEESVYAIVKRKQEGFRQELRDVNRLHKEAIQAAKEWSALSSLLTNKIQECTEVLKVCTKESPNQSPKESSTTQRSMARKPPKGG